MTDKTYLSYFSPTHTSRHVGRAVAEECKGNSETIDLNATYQPLEPTLLQANDLLIVSVPVYGGHVAPIALQRLEALRGQHTPAVAIVVYGNRNFEKAAIDLQDFLTERQFNVIATAAFVGEHSYSTAEYPISPNRPNADDLQEARAFGQAVLQKLQANEVPASIHAEEMQCPDSGAENLKGFAAFIQEYQAHAKNHPGVKLIPTVDTERCNGCGSCAIVCPTGAIDLHHPETTDPAKCIKCCACVKHCPQQARSLATPFGPVLSKYFKTEKNNVWLV